MLNVVGKFCILSCWSVTQSTFMNSFSIYIVDFHQFYEIHLYIVEIRISCRAIMPSFITLPIFYYSIPVFYLISYADLGLDFVIQCKSAVTSQDYSYHQCHHYYHLKYKQNQHADPYPHIHTQYLHPPHFPDSHMRRKTNQEVVAINLKEQNVDKQSINYHLRSLINFGLYYYTWLLIMCLQNACLFICSRRNFNQGCFGDSAWWLLFGIISQSLQEIKKKVYSIIMRDDRKVENMAKIYKKYNIFVSIEYSHKIKMSIEIEIENKQWQYTLNLYSIYLIYYFYYLYSQSLLSIHLLVLINFLLLICQLKLQYQIMSKLHRTSPKLNLNKLKRCIDVKIQSILRYLEQQQTTTNQQPQPLPQPTLYPLTSIKQQLQTKLCQLDIPIANPIQAIDEPRKESTDDDEHREEERISITEYLSAHTQINRGSEQIEEPVQDYTSPKRQRVTLLSDEKSEESDYKEKIEANASLKIFGASLTNSLNYVNIGQSFIFNNNDEGIHKRMNSGNNTARSKRSTKNKQNDKMTPIGSLSKEKRLGSRKTPHKTPHSNHYSTAKKLYEYFSGFERESKLLSQAVVIKMKSEVEQLYKKCRKEGQENNVRIKLLKRIENCKAKP